MNAGRKAAAVGALTLFALAAPSTAWGQGVANAPAKVSSAWTAVSTCGSLSGLGLSWTSTANVVTAVTLTTIPAACSGGSLSLTLVGAGNAALGSAGPVSVSGTSQTLSTITGSPTSTSVTGAYVSVVGP